jgi:mevalonate kinase
MRTYARSATEIVGDLTAVLSAPTPDPVAVGGLLNQGQVLLRQLVRCSTDLIDECVHRCMKAGAYGAKLTGSGHGGCLFALAPLDALGPVMAALRDLPVRVMVFTTGEPHGVVFPPSDF